LSVFSIRSDFITRVGDWRETCGDAFMRLPTLSPRASLIMGAVALAALIFAMSVRSDVILYNPSDSLPKGFYMRSGGTPGRGSIVAVQAVRVAPDYAKLREFDDAGDRFLKRVAAVAGDRVCAEGDAVTINDGPPIPRRRKDAEGRALPVWIGCATLSADDVFLLGDHDQSFDGRYFGITKRADIEGVWHRFPERRE
jgi:type IV secretory pathway protease TraF